MASTSIPSSVFGTAVRTDAISDARAAAIPWYIWCAALAITSVMIGGHWDISWHSSIGRDTFWTPAHMAIYLCGILAGVSFGYLILHTTFSKHSPLAESSVNIWGFRAPLGAFIASWGGITMLTSAPFDNWWHDAYGLDVKIISPPHIVLFIGVYGVIAGTMILIASHMNRSTGRAKETARWLFLYTGGVVLTVAMVMLMETTSRAYLHNAGPYIAMAALTPAVFAIGSRATRIPFAATAIAGVYTFVNIALIQILPLFPAEPKLGPVYQPVTHFIPPQFPILLIIPALALDLLWQRTPNWGVWKRALVSALVYVGLLLAVEWPFASFLMSPAARNRFFGTIYLYYALPPGSFLARSQFYITASPFEFAGGMLLAVALAALTLRLGFSRGTWMQQVQR
jgi:hypothetical protein